MKNLKNVSGLLDKLSLSVPDDNDKEVIENLVKVLNSPDSVSTFEFLSSKIFESLLNYLNNGPSPKGMKFQKLRKI